MITTKIIKFHLNTTDKFSPAYWHIRDGLIEKPINIVKTLFGKNVLSEEDTTIGVDRTIFVSQDNDGNFKLPKGLWKFTIDSLVELTRGNLAFASTNFICLNLNIKKNGIEVNKRASSPCIIDYFKEEIFLKIENETDLISMNFFPKIFGEDGLKNADTVRKEIQGNIKTTEFTFKKLSFIAEKIGDLE
jgi:hypothetical protein